MDPHAVENVLRFNAVVELTNGRFPRRTKSDDLEGIGCGLRVGLVENLSPVTQHVFCVVETLAEITTQSFAKEGGRGFPQVGVEEGDIERDFGLDHGRVGDAVAPARQCAGEHLVERHGCGKALGVNVPAWRLAQAEEGIEVGARAGLDVVDGSFRQGEVEQHQLQAAAMRRRAKADVVGLDVAVIDAFVFQEDDRLQQFLAETPDEIQRGAVVAQEMSQRVLAGTAHQQRRAAGNGQRFAPLDNIGMAQLAQGFTFGNQAPVVAGVQGNLEDQLFGVAASSDQQHIG